MRYVIKKRCLSKINTFYRNVSKKYKHTQQLKDGVRNEILKKLKGIGASHRQLERLTGTFRLRYEQRMLACYAMP